MENEIDESDLEAEYEEKMLKEFTELVDEFQKKNSFENVSLLRLMNAVEDKILDEISFNFIHEQKLD